MAPRLRLRATLALALIASPAATRAQSTATVALDDPVYALVDRLLARMPVRGATVAQRPSSRRELARIARAVAASPRATDADVRALLDAVVALVGDTAAHPARATLRAVDRATLDVAANSVAPRAIPSNGLGTLNALSTPPLDAREGRPVVRGAATSLETEHALDLGPIALVARPRATWLAGNGASRVTIVPQRLVARGVAHNVALQAGIDAIVWGQGSARSLLLSNNAPPLRSIALGTDTAVALPWIFRYLGPVRATVLVADLGRAQNFPHAKLAGYKVTLAPSPRFEIGTGLLSQYGGHGAPPLNLEQRVVDLFPYVTWIHPGTSRSRDKLASNKLAGVDARWRVPSSLGLSLYWEGEIDDFDPSRLPGLLWLDGSHLFGARFDALGAPAHRGDASLDVQFRHASLRIMEHAQFTSGVTYRQFVLGDPLGPNANAGSAAYAWHPTPFAELSLRGTVERRDPSLYASVFDDSTFKNFRFERVADRPVETRARLELGARRDAAHGIGLSARLGVDRVANENFVVRDARWRPFAEAVAVWRR